MARTLYAGRPGDTVAALYALGERYVYALPADANGDPTSVTLTVWDEPDGTQYTDLLAADGVTPITAVVVPPGTVQIPAFYGPDGVDTEVWLQDPDGDYTRLDIGAPGPAGAGDVNGPVTSTADRFATFSDTTGKAIKDSGLSLDTDTTLSANSDTKIPSQKAVKAYADSILAAQDAMVFKGVINCSTNPNYPAANRGDTYRVSVAGKIGGASGTNVEVGDLLLCLTDGTAAGTQAAVGANWSIVQTNIDGAVVGPSSATSGNVPTFNGTTGKIVQDSGVALSSLALLASPAFTGNPTAPTQAASDDSTKLANTAHVKDAIQGGSVIALGSITGSVSLSSSLTAATAVNATVTCTLTGNTTFTAATMPTVAAGTQFTLNVTQDGTGSRTLTLTNILKPGGSLTLSTAAGAKDQIVFFYDGTNWWAALTGKAWAV